VLEERGRIPVRETLECGWQICSALQYLHNHGVVHRDLKPSNLFLSDDGLIKLGDFGIALDVQSPDITEQGMTVGSHCYMSPELIRGERSDTGRTDLYALGCLLYQMVTGSVPYPGTNFAHIFEQHLHADPPTARSVVSDCPVELDKVIKHLLAKDPDQRPFSARAVQGMLGDALVDWCEANGRQIEDLRQSGRAGQAILARLLTSPQTVDESTDFGVSWKTLALGFGLLVALVILSLVV